MGKEYALQVGVSAAERLEVLDGIHRSTSDSFVAQLCRATPQRLLDLGCGTGLTTARLARLAPPNAEIVGIDRAGDQITLAQASFGTPRVHFQVSDIEDPDVDLSAFDLIYGRFVLGHNPDSSAILKRLYARLKPGAVLAFEEPDIGSAFSIAGSGGMEQAEELYILLGRVLKQDFATATALVQSALALDGDAHVAFVQPILTKASSKRLYQLGLDEVRPRYLEHGISTEAELDGLRQRLIQDIQDETVYFASARIAQIALRKR